MAYVENGKWRRFIGDGTSVSTYMRSEGPLAELITLEPAGPAPDYTPIPLAGMRIGMMPRLRAPRRRSPPTRQGSQYWTQGQLRGMVPHAQTPGSECLSVNRNRFGFGICSPGSVRFGAWQVRVRFGLVQGRSGFGSVWCMAGLGSVRFCRPHGRVRFGFSALELGSVPILIPKSNREARGSGMGGATRMRCG